MRVFVLGNAQRPGVVEEAERLLPFVRQHAEVVVCDLEQKVDLSGHEADLTLVLGGDGAILRAARQMGYRQVPVLGVNLGRLGFLADLGPEELRRHFPDIACGECNFRVTEHLMFEGLVEAADGDRATLPDGGRFLGLNEIAIQTGPPFHMVEVDLIIDGAAVARYRGDGLIVSTPVGSTAHSLSAGGPIMGQDLAAFVITPICPHTLTNRPLVDSANKVYTIAIRGAPSGAWLIIDGQEYVALSAAHSVTLRKAPVTFKLVKVPGRSFYQILHDKLLWGTQPTYREESGVRSQGSGQDSAATGPILRGPVP
jgi:NAD+ kinase